MMQREFLGLLRETRDAGRTVFLSSHILPEVEAVADTVGDPPPGRARHHPIRRGTQGPGPPPARPDVRRHCPDRTGSGQLPAYRTVSSDGRIAHVVVTGSTAELIKAVAPYEVTNLVSHEADLEAVFLDYYDDPEVIGMFRNVYLKSLYDARRGLFGWSVAIAS